MSDNASLASTSTLSSLTKLFKKNSNKKSDTGKGVSDNKKGSDCAQGVNDSAAKFVEQAKKNGWNAPTATYPSLG